jgi:hypothetical protein
VSSDVTFERLTRSKLAGCAAYLLMVPMLGLIGAIAGGFAGMGLALLFRGGETLQMSLVGSFALLGLLGAFAMGIRDYRRRAGGVIRIDDDRLEVLRRAGPDVYRFDQLKEIQGCGFAFLKILEGPVHQSVPPLTLRSEDGRILSLSIEEWPLADIGAELSKRALPRLTERLKQRIEAGETVSFGSSRLLALRYLAIGLLCSTAGLALIYAWWRQTPEEHRYRALTLPLLLLTTGIGALAMVKRAGSGLSVGSTGVSGRDGKLVPWTQLRRLRELSDSFTLETQEGRTLRLGMLAANYDVCLELLRSRVSRN